MKKGTKELLLDSATQIFASQGFREGKVADIAENAGANIAAVNYHFGSKEELFVAVMKSTFAVADAKFPMNGNLPEDASPEDKLMAFCESLIRRSFEKGPAGDFNRIMSNSIEAPGTPFERVMKEVHELEISHLEASLDLLLPQADAETKNQAKLNCLFLSVMLSKAKFASPMIFGSEPSLAAIESYIQRQKVFILTAVNTLAI